MINMSLTQARRKSSSLFYSCNDLTSLIDQSSFTPAGGNCYCDCEKMRMELAELLESRRKINAAIAYAKSDTFVEILCSSDPQDGTKEVSIFELGLIIYDNESMLESYKKARNEAIKTSRPVSEVNFSIDDTWAKCVILAERIDYLKDMLEAAMFKTVVSIPEDSDED